MTTHLIASRSLIDALPAATRARVHCAPAENLVDARWAELERASAGGDALIIIGAGALGRLRPLWVDAGPCQAAALRPPDETPLPLPPVRWREAACRGLFVRPPETHVYFGRDEMPRMELLPLAVAADAGGRAWAYPAAWFKHVGASLVGGRFAGSHWFAFAIERPLEALDAPGWSALIDALCDRAESRIALLDVRAHYPLAHAGETVRIDVRLANHAASIAAARVDLTAERPDGRQWTSRWIRRALNGREEVTLTWEFPVGADPGLWRVSAELFEEDRFAYGAAREDGARLVERAGCGVVVAPPDADALARPEIDGRELRIGDADGFVTGVHYYPSSSWFDWAWRDFRPERAAHDLDEMARLGYRLARVWVDPELDEAALRGLDAWLALSGMRGIVSIVCIFTQWARHLSYPDEHGATTFEFMGPADYNVYSVQLINIAHQQRYVATLARRWRAWPNVIWNLANEAMILDPDPEQVDVRYFGDVTPRAGPEAGPAYFNRWADLMTEALRDAGAQQPVLRGYGFPMGGDCYLQNRDGDFLVWHHYAPPEIAGPSLPFGDPGIIEKPYLLEEFGAPTFDEAARRAHYEGLLCWAVALGAAGACAYEWGVSWLARELPYVATPLKDLSLFAEVDPRWGPGGQLPYSASWPVGTLGLCPWAASFCYGCNFGGTPFPTPAAEALGRVGRFCAGIGAPQGREPVVLVVPREWALFAPQAGYAREMAPTAGCVRALAAAHVPFSVAQADQIAALDPLPEALIYPASGEVSPEAAAVLEALAARGAAVHTGAPEAWIEALAPYAMAVESSRPVWCLRRRTRDGCVFFIYDPAAEGQDGDAVAVRLDDGVDVRVWRTALVRVHDGGGVQQFP